MSDDLWGDLPDAAVVVTPLEILKKQASLLAEKTKRKLAGQINQLKSDKGYVALAMGKPNATLYGKDFHYELNIVAPFVNNYSYALLEIAYNIVMYPVLVFDPSQKVIYPCDTADEFQIALGSIFRADKTREVISALLKQSQAT